MNSIDLLPSSYKLSQNYPNPFRNETKIKYCIPDKVKIKLEILDPDINTIKTIADDFEEPGTYEIIFDAKSLPSGVYFYRLQAGSFVETKKMVLMK
jgi:hypothetical protein